MASRAIDFCKLGSRRTETVGTGWNDIVTCSESGESGMHRLWRAGSRNAIKIVAEPGIHEEYQHDQASMGSLLESLFVPRGEW